MNQGIKELIHERIKESRNQGIMESRHERNKESRKQGNTLICRFEFQTPQ